MASTEYSYDENAEVAATPLSEFVRLFLLPLSVSVLVVGGGYWLHELAAGSTNPEQQASTMQVRLIVNAEPPAPAAAATPQTPSQFVAPGPDLPPQSGIDEQDRPADGETPVSAPPKSQSPAESAPASRETPVSRAIGTLKSSTATNFQRALLRHIERYQNYPSAARRLRLQGTVFVLFSMRRDGAVLDVWIKTSSGAAILDEEAVETIRRAQPLPPIPSDLPGRLNVVIPVAFNLS